LVGVSDPWVATIKRVNRKGEESRTKREVSSLNIVRKSPGERELQLGGLSLTSLRASVTPHKEKEGGGMRGREPDSSHGGVDGGVTGHILWCKMNEVQDVDRSTADLQGREKVQVSKGSSEFRRIAVWGCTMGKRVRFKLNGNG